MDEGGDHSNSRLKQALLAALECDMPTASLEAQVHAALDAPVLPHGALARDHLESISCLLFRMQLYRRQGRVNAYASGRLRVQRLAEAL